MMFSNKQLLTLLLPIMVEQLLNSFMGMADTMMVSNVEVRQSLRYHWWIPSMYWSYRYLRH